MKQFILIQFILFLHLFVSSNPPAQNSLQDDTLLQAEQIAPCDLKVYPNPAQTGQVHIEMIHETIKEVRLVNIAGKEILHRKPGWGTRKYQLNLDRIPNGIYFLRVKTTDNQVVVKKLVVSSH